MVPMSPSDRSHKTLEEVKQEHIKRVLDSVAGNKTEAAKILGVDRRTLIRRGYQRIKKAP